MLTMYIICAAAGGTVLACQFVLTLFALGDHHDGGGDHDLSHDVHDFDHSHGVGHGMSGSWFVGILTLRTIVAALTFFGLAGWFATAKKWDEPVPLGVAFAAGCGALFAVAWIMRSLHRLQAEGNIRMERALGKVGTVYLKIPGNRAGAGKVLLNLQNRTVEYQAITSSAELPTGARVVIVGIVSSDTVEVAPATAEVNVATS
jgi:hypothetical protein